MNTSSSSTQADRAQELSLSPLAAVEQQPVARRGARSWPEGSGGRSAAEPAVSDEEDVRGPSVERDKAGRKMRPSSTSGHPHRVGGAGAACRWGEPGLKIWKPSALLVQRDVGSGRRRPRRPRGSARAACARSARRFGPESCTIAIFAPPAVDHPGLRKSALECRPRSMFPCTAATGGPSSCRAFRNLFRGYCRRHEE